MSDVELATFLTDSIHGTPVTFTETDKPTLASTVLTSILPDAKPRAAGVVRGNLRNHSGNEGNTLCTSAAPLKDGHVTLWRFVGIQPSGDGAFSVDMSTEPHFGSSWGMRGISQRSNGNLCGRGMERGSWAKGYTGSSTVDWFVELKNKVVDIYPVVDGEVQGHAFRLDFNSKPELVDQLRPSISFSDNANDLKVLFVEFEAVPIQTEEAPYHKRKDASRTSAEGKWDLIAASASAMVVPDPVELNVTPERLSLRVFNTMTTSAAFHSDGTAKVSEMIMMTKMLPPAQFRDAERAFQTFLPKIVEWKLDDHNHLVLNNEYHFRPVGARGGPVSSDVFN